MARRECRGNIKLGEPCALCVLSFATLLILSLNSLLLITPTNKDWHVFVGTKTMFKKLDISSTLIAGAIAAILFSIPVYLYIRASNYEQSWMLYFGSFLFMIVMWIHTIRESRKKNNNESTVALAFSSHMTAIAGIIFSCLICFLLLSLFVPGYLDAGKADKVLKEAPVNIIHDKTNGLSFNVFMAATVINFSVGSFTGIILPFYLKKNQTRDSKKPTPLHE